MDLVNSLYETNIILCKDKIAESFKNRGQLITIAESIGVKKNWLSLVDLFRQRRIEFNVQFNHLKPVLEGSDI